MISSSVQRLRDTSRSSGRRHSKMPVELHFLRSWRIPTLEPRSEATYQESMDSTSAIGASTMKSPTLSESRMSRRWLFSWWAHERISTSN